VAARSSRVDLETAAKWISLSPPPKPRKHGTRQPPGSIAAIVGEIRDRAGVERFTPHDLRRSFGTTFLDRDGDLALLQKMMGHTDVQTTAIYDRRAEAAMRRAATKLDLPGLKTWVGATAPVARKPAKENYSLAEVFHRDRPLGDHGEEHLSVLEGESRNQRFTMEMIQLPEREVSAVELEQYSGTDEHRRLCALAADYIRRRGFVPTSTPARLRYEGGIADVAELGGRRIFAECGYTAAVKVLRGVASGREMLVVPYLGTKPTVAFLLNLRRYASG